MKRMKRMTRMTRMTRLHPHRSRRQVPGFRRMPRARSFPQRYAHAIRRDDVDFPLGHDPRLCQCERMFSGFTGWHLMIIVAVLAIPALVVFGIYWVARLGARRGILDRSENRHD
jgi:hypothetical protein